MGESCIAFSLGIDSGSRFGLAKAATKTKTLKVSTLVPQGTTWAKSLGAMAKEVARQTQGRVRFNIYYGGVVGDEAVVLRKIRIGQMHGAFFTGRTLGQIHGDVRVMEVPFTFKHDRAKALKVLRALAPSFDRGFERNGFKNLGFFEIGKVYLVSTKKVTNLQQLRGIKVWSWEGDELVALFSQEMKLVSVPLALPDVLTALSTGIVDAAYASPMGVLALQWSSKVKYLVDFPLAYSIGGLLISLGEWKKIGRQDRRAVERIVAAGLEKSSEQTMRENVQALQALRSVGVEFNQFPASDIAEADRVGRSLFGKLQEKKVLTPEVMARFRRAVGR